MAAIIDGYRYANCWLKAGKLLPRRLRPATGIERVVFAATKADHATKSHRHNMVVLLEWLVQLARASVARRVRDVQYEWFTSIRGTEDVTGAHMDRPIEALKGRHKEAPETQKPYWYPGIVPSDWPTPLADGTAAWPFDDQRFRFLEFLPLALPLLDGAPWPHMNLDTVLWKVLGACFR